MNHTMRIANTFANNKAFIAYLTAGDGGIEKTLKAALALIEGGVNMLEIGVPFSDPIADGSVIQRAAMRALSAGTTLKDVLWLTQQIRKYSDIPLILFSYFNPILTALKTSFLQDAKQAGIDGILIVDCPLEESHAFHEQCVTQALAPIYVIAPTTPLERICKMDAHGQGFLYYACRKGTTGIQKGLPDDFVEKIQHIKAHTHLPVVVGFGISDRDMAQKVWQHADGVVVGSLFVKALEDGMDPSALTQLAMDLDPTINQSTEL